MVLRCQSEQHGNPLSAPLITSFERRCRAGEFPTHLPCFLLLRFTVNETGAFSAWRDRRSHSAYVVERIRALANGEIHRWPADAQAGSNSRARLAREVVMPFADRARRRQFEREHSRRRTAERIACDQALAVTSVSRNPAAPYAQPVRRKDDWPTGPAPRDGGRPVSNRSGIPRPGKPSTNAPGAAPPNVWRGGESTRCRESGSILPMHLNNLELLRRRL